MDDTPRLNHDLDFDGNEDLDTPYIPVAEYNGSNPTTGAHTSDLSVWRKLLATTIFGPIVAFTILIVGLALAINLVGLEKLGTQYQVEDSVDIPLEDVGAKARSSLQCWRSRY